MFETADPKQPFLVLNRVDLFPDDEKVMVKLYQPLVGATAIALYQTLIQAFDPYSMLSDAEGIYTLQEQLDCSLKELFRSLHKLEGVGLVQTFLADNVVNQVLAFKLLKVPSAQEFFSTSLLASLLKEKVGIEKFSKLSHQFARASKLKQKEIPNAKDISASFLEVFRLPGEEAISPANEVLQAAKENDVPKIEKAQVNHDDHIDWNFMKDQYARYQIEPDQIEINKAQILGVIRTYGLTEQEFIDESLPTLHGDRNLNMRAIENLIADNYRSAHTRKQIKTELNNHANIASPSQISAKTKQLLVDANKLSPAEFLYQAKAEKGGFSSPSEKKVLNVLQNQYGLPSDLINILIYACLTYDSMVSSNLAYRIANDWLQHGVASSTQAMQYLEKRKKQRKYNQSRRFNTGKRVEKGTDWSKKKIKSNNQVDSEELKNFFKNLEDQDKSK